MKFLKEEIASIKYIDKHYPLNKEGLDKLAEYEMLYKLANDVHSIREFEGVWYHVYIDILGDCIKLRKV